jgi:transcriptional regulator with XRE-family HTH domain
MEPYSQIAIIFARPEFRKTANDRRCRISQSATMLDAEDKNGGPNHLRAWMRFRNVKGQQLADALGGNVTAGMVSDLANSKRALSAKWLRRIAPILKTTPGHLLDHDPTELPTDIAEIWVNADAEQRRQLVAMAKVIVPDRAATGS